MVSNELSTSLYFNAGCDGYGSKFSGGLLLYTSCFLLNIHGFCHQ